MHALVPRDASGRSDYRMAAIRPSQIGLADEDEAAGRGFSASDKLERASLYLLVAERMQGHGHPGRAETYARALDKLSGLSCDSVVFDLGDARLVGRGHTALRSTHIVGSHLGSLSSMNR